MELASGALQQKRGHEHALLMRGKALLALGDMLGAASDLRASKAYHTNELEALDEHISIAREKVSPLCLCVAAYIERWACLAMRDLLGPAGILGAGTEADCRQLWRLQLP